MYWPCTCHAVFFLTHSGWSSVLCCSAGASLWWEFAGAPSLSGALPRGWWTPRPSVPWTPWPRGTRRSKTTSWSGASPSPACLSWWRLCCGRPCPLHGVCGRKCWNMDQLQSDDQNMGGSQIENCTCSLLIFVSRITCLVWYVLIVQDVIRWRWRIRLIFLVTSLSHIRCSLSFYDLIISYVRTTCYTRSQLNTLLACYPSSSRSHWMTILTSLR